MHAAIAQGELGARGHKQPPCSSYVCVYTNVYTHIDIFVHVHMCMHVHTCVSVVLLNSLNSTHEIFLSIVGQHSPAMGSVPGELSSVLIPGLDAQHLSGHEYNAQAVLSTPSRW